MEYQFCPKCKTGLMVYERIPAQFFHYWIYQSRCLNCGFLTSDEIANNIGTQKIDEPLSAGRVWKKKRR